MILTPVELAFDIHSNSLNELGSHWRRHVSRNICPQSPAPTNEPPMQMENVIRIACAKYPSGLRQDIHDSTHYPTLVVIPLAVCWFVVLLSSGNLLLLLNRVVLSTDLIVSHSTIFCRATILPIKLSDHLNLRHLDDTQTHTQTHHHPPYRPTCPVTYQSIINL